MIEAVIFDMDGVLADTEYYYENRRKNFLLENGIPIPEGNFIGSNEKAIWEALVMAIPAYYSLLQRGSSGPDVALVQTWLNGVRDACTWYSELKADGKFGISTENAVKEFQLKNKMNVDGKVGANTWNVLYTRYTAKHGLHVPYPGIALRSGSSGGTVRLVQQKLNSLGERLTADGRFGAATAAAVQRFQRRNGLTADGAVGEGTWEKMF